jgi:hypothetical protein
MENDVQISSSPIDLLLNLQKSIGNLKVQRVLRNEIVRGRETRAREFVGKTRVNKIHDPTGIAPLQLEESHPEEPSRADIERSIRTEYVRLAEEKISEVESALAYGYIWELESERATGLMHYEVADLESRAVTLRRFAELLRQFIVAVQSGARYGMLRPGFVPPETIATNLGPRQLANPFSHFCNDRGIDAMTLNRPQSLLRVGRGTLSVVNYIYYAPNRVPPADLPPVRFTGMYVVINDPDGAPQRVAGLMTAQQTGFASFAAGPYFELWRAGDVFFYRRREWRRGERRIYLQGLARRYPSLRRR